MQQHIMPLARPQDQSVRQELHGLRIRVAGLVDQMDLLPGLRGRIEDFHRGRELQQGNHFIRLNQAVPGDRDETGVGALA